MAGTCQGIFFFTFASCVPLTLNNYIKLVTLAYNYKDYQNKVSIIVTKIMIDYINCCHFEWIHLLNHQNSQRLQSNIVIG